MAPFTNENSGDDFQKVTTRRPLFAEGPVLGTYSKGRAVFTSLETAREQQRYWTSSLRRVSTESVPWRMMHQRLGWCWGTTGCRDRSLLPASPSAILYFLVLSHSETKLWGTHAACSLPASPAQDPGLHGAPRHFSNAKINTELRAKQASGPT